MTRLAHAELTFCRVEAEGKKKLLSVLEDSACSREKLRRGGDGERGAVAFHLQLWYQEGLAMPVAAEQRLEGTEPHRSGEEGQCGQREQPVPRPSWGKMPTAWRRQQEAHMVP